MRRREHLCRWHIQFTAAHCNTYHNPLSRIEWENANMKNVSRTRERIGRKSFTQFAQSISIFDEGATNATCVSMRYMGINFQVNYPLAIWKLIAQISLNVNPFDPYAGTSFQFMSKKVVWLRAKTINNTKYEFEFSSLQSHFGESEIDKSSRHHIHRLCICFQHWHFYSVQFYWRMIDENGWLNN